MRTLSLCRGLWIPGVSRNAIWPRGSLRMPTMRFRVVWGFVETMETFCPRMRLSRVDLPALGRPTRATTPNFVSPTPLLPALVAIQDPERLSHDRFGGGQHDRPRIENRS